MLSLKEAKAIVKFVNAAVDLAKFATQDNFATKAVLQDKLLFLARENDNAEAAKIRTRYDPADNLGPETDHDL